VKTRLTLQTIALAAALIGLALLTGWQLMGSWAMLLLIGFVASVGISLMRTGPRVRLRDARPIRYFEAPRVFDIVDRLACEAGLSRAPDLHYARSRTMNAATIGTGEEASIVVTDGLLSALGARELEAVLAHEIAHIRNRDLSLFRLVEIVRQATLMFARVGWLLVLFALPLVLFGGVLSGGALLVLLAAPAASWLLQLALLRTREFAADATAAELTGDPEGLALALRRIDRRQQDLLRALLPIGQTDESSLFRTHPPTEERVARLLAGSGSRRRGVHGYAHRTGEAGFPPRTRVAGSRYGRGMPLTSR